MGHELYFLLESPIHVIFSYESELDLTPSRTSEPETIFSSSLIKMMDGVA